MIRVESISKKYKIYHRQTDRLKEWLCPGNQKFHKEFWALRDIDLHVFKGSSVGIIGPNGAGKSTLLKIITGTTKPTLGTIAVQGRIAGLLELGMGFHPEFTGRQNIVMNAKMLGLNDDEISRKMGSVIQFAELGDFIDQPLRTYSSGMYVRLGFAVATCVEPDILIIDEALSVGDIYFQQKCMRKMREFKQRDITILFVSHDPGAIKNLCDEVILLNEGQIVDRGKPDDVLNYYNSLIARKTEQGENPTFQIEKTVDSTGGNVQFRSGNFKAVISSIELVNEKGEEQSVIVSGQKVFLKARCYAIDKIEDPTFGFLIKDRLGNDVFGTNSYYLEKKIGDCDLGELIDISLAFDANLGPGEYTLTVALHKFESHLYECYDWIDKTLSFKIIPSADFNFIGVARLLPTLEIERKKTDFTSDLALYASVFADAPSTIGMGKAYQKYLINGWYNCEEYSGESLRWTQRSFSFVIAAKGRRITLSSTCSKPDIESDPLRFEFFANKKSIGTFQIDTPNATNTEIEIPKDLANSVVLFSCEIKNPWKPSELSTSSDQRELGTCVRKITVE